MPQPRIERRGAPGKETNRLYVDTDYDPDPQSSHGEAAEPMTAKQVLAGVLHNEGAEVAAHDMIRREHQEAEGMERLSAEYLTLATDAQAERWESLLARSGLSDVDLASVAASQARGPLFAGLRDAEARGLDVEKAVPQLISGKSLGDAADIASVLHSRVDRWTKTAGGRHRHTENLIAGLIPRAQGVIDPDMARALAERDHAMDERSRVLAEEAIVGRHRWVLSLGSPPGEPAPRERWMRRISTIAAYRDRWHIEGDRPLGAAPDRKNLEQIAQRKIALSAGQQAKSIGTAELRQQIDSRLESGIQHQRQIEL
jgi:hypothetical protein